MILPAFVLPSRANQHWAESGIDSLGNCLNRRHFLNYAHNVDYQYNSRGFRDADWPNTITALENAIWCVGDSFTVGLGSPVEHTWPYILQQQTGRRCINLSMDGASNQWIARKIQELAQEVVPKNVIIHWSYINRRELQYGTAFKKTIDLQWSDFYNAIKDFSWPKCNSVTDIVNLPESILKEIVEVHSDIAHTCPTLGYQDYYQKISDEDRRLWHGELASSDINDTIKCIDQVTEQCFRIGTDLTQSFIPEFASSNVYSVVVDHLVAKGAKYVPAFDRIDVARDGHHYDLETAKFFVKNIIKNINC